VLAIPGVLAAQNPVLSTAQKPQGIQ